MLYWQYSRTRLFIISEYWALIPPMLVVNYFYFRRAYAKQKRIREFEELKAKTERYKKIRRVAFLALSLNGLPSTFIYRGGSDYIDVDYLDCGIEEGLRYLNNDRLRRIIYHLYGDKSKKKLIFITATALCHISKIYGKDFLSLPFAIGDFGVTNLYQTIRKTFVVILFGSTGPLYLAGGPIAGLFAAMLACCGLRLALINPDKIATGFIDPKIPAQSLTARIIDLPDVVSINWRNNIRKSVPEKVRVECWIAEQALLNPRCNVKATDIPSITNGILHDLSYNDVVNMQDVTGLDRVDFSDVLDLGQTTTDICKPSAGKTVNFLDLFSDPKDISDTETWDASEVSNKILKNMNPKEKK